MSFNDHKLIDNSLGDTMLDILEEKRKGDFKMYGTTLVNLLGSYGNFEVDSNADGLADGWSLQEIDSFNMPAGLIGSYCQKVKPTLVVATHRAVKTFQSIIGHTYFMSAYTKIGSLNATPYVKIMISVLGGVTNTKIITGTTSWQRLSKKSDVATSASSYITLETGQGVHLGDANDEFYFDGVMLIDLTERGALDPVRQAKYGVANWEDLTEAQLEAEIPYFDSVMSVNVEDGTASELTVENRGKNLFDKSAITSNYYIRYDSGSIGALASWFATDFIEVKPSTTYHITYGDGSQGAFYDINKKYISGLIYSSSSYLGTFVTPSKCAYFRGCNPLTLLEQTQLEESSTATAYVPPREDSITIPDTCELHALEGRHDYVEYDADEEKLLYVSFIEREDKTTDGSGDFALTGAVSGSRVLVRDKTTGAVEWCTESEGSVHTSTISDDVEIWYIRATPTSTAIYGLYSGNFLKALKNNIVIDSKLPVAMGINDSNQSGYVITQNFME